MKAIRLWGTIGRLVDSGHLPPPSCVAPGTERLTIKVAGRAEVETWRRHIGMPPGRDLVTTFGSVDFLPEPGWCGFTTIYVYCDIAGPLRVLRDGGRR